MKSRTLAVFLWFILPCGAVQAQISKCDCNEIVGSCSAEIELDENKGIAIIKSDANICARVGFYVDNTPYSALFNNGSTAENVSIFDKKKKVSVSVQQCAVCKYDGDDGQAGRPDGGTSLEQETLTGEWSEGNNYVLSFRDGTIFENGIVVGTYSGRSGKTRVEHPGNTPPPMVCDISMESKDKAIAICTGGGMRKPARWEFPRIGN